MSSVLHRSPDTPPLAGRAFETAYEWKLPGVDPRANPHIEDMSSGAGVACLGLQQYTIKDKISDAMTRLPYAHSAQWTTDNVELAAAIMVEAMEAPFKGGACVFYSSGSEAVEAACKIAAQHVAWSTGRKARFIGRQHSYHGNTAFALALGDHPRKNTINALGIKVEGVLRVPTPSREFYALHSRFVESTLEATLAAAEECVGRNEVPVIVIEPIGGTTIGISPPPLDYLKGLARIRKTTGALLIYDEVLCGNWRTGFMTAWQCYQSQIDVQALLSDSSHSGDENIAPDVIVMGKGIAAGYFPISCVIVTELVRRAVETLGRLWHTTTNQNHPVGCAGVIAAQEVYRNVITNGRGLREQLVGVVIPELRALPQVRWVTGVGLLWGIQLDPMVPGLHALAKAHLLKQGFTVYSDGGTVMKPGLGAFGNMLLLAPPFNMDPAVLDDFVDALASFKY